MSDEIEIEEHDLLDDPTVRNIFPDIARLKQEILDYEFNEEHQEITSTTSNSQIENINEEEKESSDCVNISKPNLIPSRALQDNFQDDKQHSGFIRGEKGIEVQVHNNKIILGTKPGPIETKSEHFEKHVKPYCSKVVLEDFGLYLKNSSRYCNECLIFFPTYSEYNIHKRKFHIASLNDFDTAREEKGPEFHNQETQKVKDECKNDNSMVQKETAKELVKIESKNENICLKCNKVYTRKDYLKSHMITVHKISKENLSKMFPNSRTLERNECFHCQKSFRTQNLLIEHIYSILQTPNNQSDQFTNKIVIGNKTNKDFMVNKGNKLGNAINNLEEVNSKNQPNLMNEHKDIVAKKKNTPDFVQNVLKYFKCNFCLLYFKTLKFFVRHMSVKHKTVKSLQATKVIFDPKCKHCPRSFESMEKYNRHLHKCHSGSLIAAIQKSRQPLFNVVKQINAVSKDLTQMYFRCPICFLYFSNTDLYFRHLLIKHKIAKSRTSQMVKLEPKCPYCPKMSNTMPSFNKHLYNKHSDKLKISRPAPSSTSERASSAVSDESMDMNTKYHSCNYCSVYFKTTRLFIRHMTLKHKMVKIPKSKKVKFSPKCKYCPKQWSTVIAYNKHIYRSHPQRPIQVIEVKRKECYDEKVKSSKHIKNPNGVECYTCCFCPSYFMTMKYYIKHVNIRHKSVKMQKPKKAIFDAKCKYCPAILNDIKIYNKHLYNKHSAELNKVVKKDKVHADNKKGESVKTFYRCCYCSYYFNNSKIYTRHVRKKHKVQHVHEVNKMIFDPKCKYCSKVFSYVESYNKHLFGSHRSRVHEVFKVFNESFKNKKHTNSHILSKKVDSVTLSSAVSKEHESKNLKLSQSDSKSVNVEKKTIRDGNVIAISKSALFKCHKCDIHFLTIKSALDHSNHMEMLINWKCALCHRIFKDDDRWLHEKQHLFSHVFTVYDIDQPNISQILYKCSKCVMHFDESVVDSHHSECALKVPQSYMCKVCDILVDNKAQICHEYNHKHRDFTSNDFIIIETAAVCEEANKKKLNNVNKNNTKSIKTVDDIGSMFENNQNLGESSSQINIPKHNLKRKIKNNENIEDFNPKKIKKSNNGGSSKNSSKNTRNDNITYSAEVSSAQQKYDNLSLKLSFCNTCKSFVSTIGQKRKAHVQKRCAHMISVVCKDCGLKLSAKTLSTHRQMHLRIKNLQLHHFKFYDFKTGKRVLPPMPEYEKCGICDVNFISKSTLGSHVCSDCECKFCDICKIKLFKPVFHLHMAFHKYRMNETNASAPANDKSSLDIAVPTKKSIEKTIEVNKNRMLLLYCCKVCYVYVDSYDRLIEHCQKHCLDNLSPQSEECEICNLPFEENCLKRHAKVHEIAGATPFEKLFFDPFYFRFDQTVWINHVFGSHSHLKVEDILLNSVYRHEHRFKMEIAQYGLPDLTLYKCLKCNRHVEADIIYQHVKSSCSNMRKYPCPICQLHFISSFALQRHKTIHNDSKPRRYRIVHFNKQEDAELNKVIFGPPKFYVVYQCRHCNVVVGSTQRMSHKCNEKDFTSCSSCGLQINQDIYELHSSMHKTLDSFISENIKVILFGQYQLHNDKYVALESPFRGKIHDYSFYKCSKCKVCVKQKNQTLNHSCLWKGQPRVACSICGLYFYADKLIPHIKYHDTDPDFVLDNMIFIEFHPSISKPGDELQITSDEAIPTNILTDLNCSDEPETAKDTAVTLEEAPIQSLKSKDITISLQSANNTEMCSENANDTSISMERTNDTLVSLEYENDNAVLPDIEKDTTVSLQSTKDIAVSKENVQDVIRPEFAKDTAVSLQNPKDIAVSIENAKDTVVQSENVKDLAENHPNSRDHTMSPGCGKNALVRPENEKNTAANLYINDTAFDIARAKDNDVILEKLKDTSVNLKNAKDTQNSSAKDSVASPEAEHNNLPKGQESLIDVALKQSQLNSLQTKNTIGDSEKIADIYLCRCGLHFLDELSITDHYSQCGNKTKLAKQNCSKCGLLFMPNVLFKHLLTHHGDKDHKFKMNIVEKFK